MLNNKKNPWDKWLLDRAAFSLIENESIVKFRRLNLNLVPVSSQCQGHNYKRVPDRFKISREYPFFSVLPNTIEAEALCDADGFFVNWYCFFNYVTIFKCTVDQSKCDRQVIGRQLSPIKFGNIERVRPYLNQGFQSERSSQVLCEFSFPGYPFSLSVGIGPFPSIPNVALAISTTDWNHYLIFIKYSTVQN